MKLPAFYPIIDTHLLHKAGIGPEEMAGALAKAGVEIAQFRHKGAFTREVFAQAQRVGRILKEAGVAYVINDRADVARMLDADGVHVGQDDLFPTRFARSSEARRSSVFRHTTRTNCAPATGSR